MKLEITPAVTIDGELRPPSDKSLTHRSYLFAAMASESSLITNPLTGEDCESTLRCMGQLGMGHEWLDATRVRLIPPRVWAQPESVLDCGNSGTTMRLLSGLIASRDLDCTLVGDASLSKRPMGRIAKPLREMGALVHGDTPPLRIQGSRLHGITYKSPVASAQIKSCVLLAGLRAEGVTTVIEPAMSRDHTERMLASLGIEFDYPLLGAGSEYGVSLRGGQQPTGFQFSVPADISSAAFFMVAAAILPGGILRIRDLTMNPTRTGILDVLREVGVAMDMSEDREEMGEPVADVNLRAPEQLRPFKIDGDMVPRLIDEIPVLCVLATQCEGVSVIRGARELRVKESDRIETMAEGLRAMGANVETFEDGLSISGPTPLHGAYVESKGDHRIAMSFAIAGLVADEMTVIEGAEAIATSYPSFEEDLLRLCIV
ncbi:3-phosphoshikimate 1-carboxyvinyltransferase [soil metagenome]